MKFQCEAKAIAGAVTAASKVVNAHTTVPILNNVLVSAQGDRVSVRATDLELTLENAVGADVQAWIGAALEAELSRLRAAGATLIDEQPRQGLYGPVAFVHPETMGGVLVELVGRQAPAFSKEAR